jgi:hypothetical protein
MKWKWMFSRWKESSASTAAKIYCYASTAIAHLAVLLASEVKEKLDLEGLGCSARCPLCMV